MLPSWGQWWFELEHFFQTGGWVLYVIWIVCIALATMIFERVFFRVCAYPTLKRQLEVFSLSEVHSRRKLSAVCDLDLALRSAFPLIKTLIAICPLVGLLGTVSGMVLVFDSLAIYGTGNLRMMASGIASATFPTMAGIAVSVAGLLFYSRLEKWAETERLQLLEMRCSILSNKSTVPELVL